MAFNVSNLSKASSLENIASVSGYQHYAMWDYSTSDNLSVVETDSGLDTGYFAAAWKNFRRFDLLRVTAGDGKALYVIDNSSFNGNDPVVGITKIASGVTSFPT